MGPPAHCGGCCGAYNAALAMHRLGLKVAWATDLGSDDFSRFILERARAAVARAESSSTVAPGSDVVRRRNPSVLCVNPSESFLTRLVKLRGDLQVGLGDIEKARAEYEQVTAFAPDSRAART